MYCLPIGITSAAPSKSSMCPNTPWAIPKLLPLDDSFLMHIHIYRSQTWEALNCSRTLMLEPRRGSLSRVFSVTMATTLLFYLFSNRKVRPGVWQASTKPSSIGSWQWPESGTRDRPQVKEEEEEKWKLRPSMFTAGLAKGAGWHCIPQWAWGKRSFLEWSQVPRLHPASSASRLTPVPRPSTYNCLPLPRLVPKIKCAMYCENITYSE